MINGKLYKGESDPDMGKVVKLEDVNYILLSMGIDQLDKDNYKYDFIMGYLKATAYWEDMNSPQAQREFEEWYE